MNKQQLANKIWASANKMRSKIEANEYKDYILGFIFYKFLSENIVKFCKDNDFSDEDLVQLKEEDTEIVKWVQEDRGYFIAYEHLYSTWIDKKFDFQYLMYVMPYLHLHVLYLQLIRKSLQVFSRHFKQD